MNKEILEAVTGEVRELLEAGSCCKEAKDAAQAWLDAVGTDKESEQAKKLVAELEEIKEKYRTEHASAQALRGRILAAVEQYDTAAYDKEG